MEASHSGKENKRKRRGGKIMIKGKEEEEKKAYSLPSLRERSETPEALDRHDWESQEVNPLPRTVLSTSVRITGYRCSGCWWGRQESICVWSGPNPNSIIGEASVQNPSLQQTRHLDFPPKLWSNSIFKPKPSQLKRVACASGLTWPA